MQSIRHIAHSRAVIVVAALLAVGSIWATLRLEQRSDVSRKAQIKLTSVQSELNDLQGLPWRINAAARGTPALALRWMQQAEQDIQRDLAELRRTAPSARLDSLSSPLRSNFALLERVRRPAAVNNYVPAGELANAATGSQDTASAALTSAGVEYDARASRAVTEANVFTVAAILLLLAAFAFFYQRSVKARKLAELLVHENNELLEASREEALTDHLTGLGNRRALINDLGAALEQPGPDVHETLVLFDLDGFKHYNDSFGHPAGDALLHRLASRLQNEIGDAGTTYRMGGDEFCLLASTSPEDGAALAQRGVAALSDRGEGFEVGCSLGVVHMPLETDDQSEALRLADDRMYQDKNSVRTSARGQTTAVLLKVLKERSADLGHHIEDVASLSVRVAERLGLSDGERHLIRVAAQLHDVGKMAVPDAILHKPGGLDDAEWELMHCHTLIGERIANAAPALAPAAKLIRASHERFDGQGYPDKLRGTDIPLGSRIIFVCDAFDAMVAERPYRHPISVPDALTELHRCAGTQFDPQIVEAFCAVLEAPDDTQVEHASEGPFSPASPAGRARDRLSI
jgi:two-component system cell cycle response regulator